MRRPTRTDADAPGYDSFLDIVANMVGILIILVVVIGVRVKNTSVVAAIMGRVADENRELEKELGVEVSLRNDVVKVTQEIQAVAKETLTQHRRRTMLATAVSALEQEIETRRGQLDTDSQRDFDLQRELAEARRRLTEFDRDRAAMEATEAEPTVVKSYPTPLSRTVDNHEAHFQLHGGRVAYVPLEELLGQLRSEIQRKKYQLRDRRELVDTLGPAGGFRLKYTLVRQDISPEMAMELGYGGQIIRLVRASFIPVSGQLGEPVDDALAERSEFRTTLAKLRPGRDTITVWTYPDSFDDFRRIKRELYLLGFSCAGRPLEEGDFISGSPQGSKSAAQ